MNTCPAVRHLPDPRQAGSTLLLILILLMVGSLMGLSIVQSSVMDERISGNYRAVVQADMAAQAGAIDTLRRLRSPEGGSSLSVTGLYDYLDDQDLFLDKQEVTGRTGADLWNLLVSTTGMQPVRQDDGRTEYVYGFYKDGSDIVMVLQARYIGTLDQGGDDPTYAYSQPVFITLAADPRNPSGGGDGGSGDPGGYPNPYAPFFQATVTACEGVAVSGGSRVAYFDSRQGVWTGTPEATTDVVIKAVTENNANITLSGNEKIYGSVQAIGTVTMTGSSEVFGDVRANGNVNINGGGVKIRSDAISVRDVDFGSSGRVDRNVIAQRDIIFRNWSASVGGYLRAGGLIQSLTSRPNACDHATGNCTSDDASLVVPLIEPVTLEACDLPMFDDQVLSARVTSLQAQLTSIGDVTVGSYPHNLWEVNESTLRSYDETWNVKDWVLQTVSQSTEFFGEQTRIFRVGNFVINNTGLTLPANSGNVFILVDGDLQLGMGGGNALTIGENSTLTFIVKGKTQVGSSVQMTGVAGVSAEGRPTLTIFSAYSGSSNGVEINGGSALVAYVYAPYSHVTVNSGGTLFGAAYGKSVNVSGNGAIIFDRAITEAEFGNGGGGGNPGNGNTGGGNKAITNWR